MTILWLDDVRDPYKYLSKKSDSGAFQRNKAFYDKLLSNGNVDFVWVKNFEEFTGYILRNGIPEFVSFDHDLGKGLKKGLDCARWLQEYCRESGQPFPKFFVHSANPNGQREINGLLNSVNESMKKKRIRLNEDILRRIIRESLQEIVLGPGDSFTPYSEEDRARNFSALYRGVKDANNDYYKFIKWRNMGLSKGMPSKELSYANYCAGKYKLDENVQGEDRYAQLDGEVKRMAREALLKVGYKECGETGNPLTLDVSINDYSDINKIKNLLLNVLGADPYYLSVNPRGPMGNRAYIMLPAFTHTKLSSMA